MKVIEKSFGPHLLFILAFSNAIWVGKFTEMDLLMVVAALMMWTIDDDVRSRKLS